MFDTSLFSLKVFDGYTPPIKMVFDSEIFWIQMHHVPLACLNIAMGEQIGKTLSRMIDSVIKDYGASGGRTLCVEVNLFKPMPRGRTLNVNGKRLWIPFTYEKLPRLCFKCGQILHGAGGCKQRDSLTTNQYGAWLRSSTSTKGSDYHFGNSSRETKVERKFSHPVVQNRGGSSIEQSDDSVVPV